MDTLEAALWAVSHKGDWSSKCFKNDVLAAVNLGEDTDTVAAVAGGLAGIIYGLEADQKSVDYARHFAKIRTYLETCARNPSCMCALILCLRCVCFAFDVSTLPSAKSASAQETCAELHIPGRAYCGIDPANSALLHCGINPAVFLFPLHKIFAQAVRNEHVLRAFFPMLYCVHRRKETDPIRGGWQPARPQKGCSK